MGAILRTGHRVAALVPVVVPCPPRPVPGPRWLEWLWGAGREVLGHPGAQAGGPPLQSAPVAGRCPHRQNGAVLGQGAEQGRGRDSGSLYELNKGALWFFSHS